MRTPNLDQVNEFARIARVDTLKELRISQSGHPGSSLSIMDVLAVLYYGGALRHDPDNPNWNERDLFVLSQGHAAPGLYACLALRGYFPRSELATLRQLGSRLQGHTKRGSVPGIEQSSGSLGQGLNFGTGLALGARLRGSDSKVVVMTSDGEQQEGSHWEGVMFGASNSLSSVLLFVDINHNQINGPTTTIHPAMDDLVSKYQAYDWHVQAIDGSSVEQISDSVAIASTIDAPSVILCDSVTGKGVSFMEGDYHWHHGVLDDAKFLTAMSDLGEPVSPTEDETWLPGTTDASALFATN